MLILTCVRMICNKVCWVSIMLLLKTYYPLHEIDSLMATLLNNIIPNKKYHIPHLVHHWQTQFFSLFPRALRDKTYYIPESMSLNENQCPSMNENQYMRRFIVAIWGNKNKMQRDNVIVISFLNDESRLEPW